MAEDTVFHIGDPVRGRPYNFAGECEGFVLHIMEGRITVGTVGCKFDAHEPSGRPASDGFEENHLIAYGNPKDFQLAVDLAIEDKEPELEPEDEK